MEDADQLADSLSAARRRERYTESALQLLRRLTTELSTLFRQEAALATAELTRSLTGLVLSLASILGGAVVILVGVVMLLLAAVLGLASMMPSWLASLSIGVLVVVIGAVLVQIGRRNLEPSGLLPRHSADSLRRDKDVLTRSRT